MKQQINDGGQAFPCEQGHTPDGTWNQTFEPGMSLRDYFAAQFMARAQSLSEDRDGGWDYDNAARCAFEMADAMLKARGA